MARFNGGSSVPGGYYWNPRQGSIATVRSDGDRLPGGADEQFVRIHGLAALLLAPVVGGLAVVALPFVGLAAFARVIGEKASGAAREGARDLAATVTPGWRPGEVHMTGNAMRRQDEELHAGGAGDKALEKLEREVAERREGEGQDG